MAVVRHYEKLTLFITNTAKPSWREVQEVVHQDRHCLTAFHRPDIVNWVLQLKVDGLFYDLRHHHIFGTYMAYRYKLNYQKHGLPHIHLLLFLHENHSYLNTTSIDEIISAVFLDKYKEPQLYDIISSTMVHDPCGEENLKFPCITKGPTGNKKCSNSFHKTINEQSLLAHNCYLVYYKRAGVGTLMTIPDPWDLAHPKVINNFWVISYSPYLCKKYIAHINIEVCGGITAIKYIHGYIYKGDKTNMLYMRDEHSEIESYVTACYISPNRESCAWEMAARYPSCCASSQPAVSVCGWTFDSRAVQKRLQSSVMTLTGFFKCNNTDPIECPALYKHLQSSRSGQTSYGSYRSKAAVLAGSIMQTPYRGSASTCGYFSK